jgi:hypothetical protein
LRWLKLAVFEDNFDVLSDKWVIIGDHPNFTVNVRDGWLNLISDWKIPPEIPHEDPFARYRPYATMGVCYSEPFNLLNRRVTVKVDMLPKSYVAYYPGLEWWSAGLMIANKVLPKGVGLLGDPELVAILAFVGYISGVPLEAIFTRITGYSLTELAGRLLTRMPPTEISMEVTRETITMYEGGTYLGEFVPPFDVSKTYVYLLAPRTIEYANEDKLLCPERVLFDYVKIEDLPPAPLTPVINTVLYTTLATSVLLFNSSLLIRSLRLIKR